jgi:hypothetical protein
MQIYSGLKHCHSLMACIGVSAIAKTGAKAADIPLHFPDDLEITRRNVPWSLQ